MPERYGPWETAYGLFRRWQRDGTWHRILDQLQAQADAEGLITWDVSVDSTIARAHQHAAGARKKGSCRSNRAYLSKRGIRCTIPEKHDQIAHRKKRGSHGGRPPKFDKADYKERWSAESIASSATARSPRDTTSSPSATRRPYWSPPSTSGCDQHFRNAP